MKKKLLLINPISKEYHQGIGKSRITKLQPLGLAIIAAITPDNWDVELLDESFDKFEVRQADLVGITALTSTVNRAYEIAGIYKELKITTVLGGIHASMMPDEALRYADSVVIGEAESVWKKVIEDFECGLLERKYISKIIDIKHLPMPQYKLFNSDYFFGSIQTSRGCPMNCDFCSVSVFNGHQYRLRSINEVIEEMKMIRQKNIFIVDDNLIGAGKENQERSLEFFKAIIKNKIEKNWICQVSINIADNDEVLKYAAKSGCRAMLIGIESEKLDSLKSIHKNQNIKLISHYADVFKKINNYGIAVLGAFIYGLDTDTIEDIHNRTEYLLKSEIDIIQITIFTPLPGTHLFNRIYKEDRLIYKKFPEDWIRYSFGSITIKPLKFTIQEFKNVLIKDLGLLFGMKNIIIRFIKTLIRTKKISTAILCLLLNISYRKTIYGYIDILIKEN